jgi:hypothetical protein
MCVQHDIQASVEELDVVQYVMHDPLLQNLKESDVRAALSAVEFTPELMALMITNLSGGAGNGRA